MPILKIGADGVPCADVGRRVTVAETAVFMRQGGALWTADERFEFVYFIPRNPEAGDLIPGSGGVRKVRWGRRGAVSEVELASSTSTMIQQCRFTC